MPESYSKLQLPLAKIRVDGGTQSRSALCSETVADYADSMRAGSIFPDLIVFQGIDERIVPTDTRLYFWLASGFHRYHAFLQAGRLAVECKVYQGTRRDALLFSVGANEKHGLRRTNEDKRKAVELLLADAEWRSRSDVWIADQCHVDRHFVARVRSMREEKFETSTIRFAKNGDKTYAVDVRNIGSRAASAILRPETDPETLEVILGRIDRSIPKAVRQAKLAGWSWEEFVSACRETWESIAVVFGDKEENEPKQ